MGCSLQYIQNNVISHSEVQQLFKPYPKIIQQAIISLYGQNRSDVLQALNILIELYDNQNQNIGELVFRIADKSNTNIVTRNELQKLQNVFGWSFEGDSQTMDATEFVRYFERVTGLNNV